MDKCINCFIRVDNREEFIKTLDTMIDRMFLGNPNRNLNNYRFYLSPQAYDTYIHDFYNDCDRLDPFYKGIHIVEDLRLVDKIPVSSDMDIGYQVKNLIGQIKLIYLDTPFDKPSQYKRTMDLDKVTITRPRITKVIFNDPATVVYWNDGDKTVVKVDPDSLETFDPEKGLAMAVVKKLMGYKEFYRSLDIAIMDALDYMAREVDNTKKKDHKRRNK